MSYPLEEIKDNIFIKFNIEFDFENNLGKYKESLYYVIIRKYDYVSVKKNDEWILNKQECKYYENRYECGVIIGHTYYPSYIDKYGNDENEKIKYFSKYVYDVMIYCYYNKEKEGITNLKLEMELINNKDKYLMEYWNKYLENKDELSKSKFIKFLSQAIINNI